MSNLNKIKTYQPLPDGSPVPEAGNLNPNYVRTDGIRVAVGALPKGYIPNGTIQDILDDIFYPFESPSITNFTMGFIINQTRVYFTSSNILKFELGAIFNCVNLQFMWTLVKPANIIANSLQLLDETQGDQIIAQQLNPITTYNTFSIAPVFAVSSRQFNTVQNYFFRLSATDLRNEVLSVKMPIQWRPRMWYGSILESSVASLAAVTNFTQFMAVLVNSSTAQYTTDLNYTKNGSYAINCGFNKDRSNKKAFFFYDASLGTSDFRNGQFLVAFNAPITIPFTNQFGVVRNYLLYISYNSFNADSVAIQVS